MNSIKLTFEHPWLLLLILPALAIILLPFLCLPKNRRSSVRKIVPVILHSIVVTILVLILSGLSFVKLSGTQAVMLLLDFSHSTRSVWELIADYTDEITSALKDTALVGTVAFGENQIYTVEFTENRKEIRLTEVTQEVSGTATDIATALEYAAGQMPADKSKRIILLSDGKETDGDALAAAQLLSVQGIQIDAMYFDTAVTTPEIQIDSILLPGDAYVGDSLILSAELQSNVADAVTLQLYDRDTLIHTQELAVMPGLSPVEIPITADTAGLHSYRIELTCSQDTIPENNLIHAGLEVAEAPTILVIADTVKNTAFMKNMLSAENAVTTTTAAHAPDSLEELCSYDEIILVNVNYRHLPKDYDKLLQGYVGTNGGSLLTIGGPGTYMFGNMKETALEEMLPVDLTLTSEQSEESVALMLILDCSSSMSNNARYLSVAKQGAIKCVEAMTENDFVGIISFSSTAKLQSEIIPSTDENKEILTRTISGLKTSRGTYYVEALELAHEKLLLAEADKKHVIFLSDGEPSDHGYLEVAEAMAEDGITLSSIGLGHSSTALSRMAEYSGGRYYYVSAASDLPDIMLTETEQIAVSSLITGDFVPTIATKSELTAEISAPLPTLGGYLGTTLKEDATAYLVTPAGHPLYATWQYGEGTVAFFASDLYGYWSDKWISSPTGQTLAKAFVSTTIDAAHDDASLQVPIPPEYDAFAPDGLALLAGICCSTDGTLTSDISNLLAEEPVFVNLPYSPLVPLGIVLAILLLADITIRKVRWKDVRNYFMK